MARRLPGCRDRPTEKEQPRNFSIPPSPHLKSRISRLRFEAQQKADFSSREQKLQRGLANSRGRLRLGHGDHEPSRSCSFKRSTSSRSLAMRLATDSSYTKNTAQTVIQAT